MVDPDSADLRNTVRSQPLFSNRIAGAADQQLPAWHWVIAALLHVPVVYGLLAVSVFDEPLALPEPDPDAAVAFEALLLPQARLEPLPASPRQTPLTLHEPGTIPNPAAGTPTPSQSGYRAAPAGAVERMTPPVMADRRLLHRSDTITHVAPVDRVRARFAESLAPINDSIIAEQRAKQRADDITVTDRNGNRWGITRGALHLGERTLRLAKATAGGHVPDLIVAAPGKRDEVNALKRNWLEIELHSSRALIKGTFDQRVSDMRQRNDSARVNAIANGAPSQTRRR